MSYFLTQVLNGLSYGLVLSLIAAGFAIGVLIAVT